MVPDRYLGATVKEKTLLIAAGILLGGAFLLMASQIITVAFFLATGSLISLGLLYMKLPLRMKRVLMWGPVRWCLDVFLSLVIPGLMGYTLTGLIAGVIFGIQVTFATMWEAKRLKEEVEEVRARRSPKRWFAKDSAPIDATWAPVTA